MLVSPTQPIRIATARFPPFANDCGVYTLDITRRCPYPGIDHEILLRLLTYANISYQLFPLTGGVDWGQLQPNGSFDGLIGDVINGKYDTISSQYLVTEVLSPQVSLSYNIHHETATYIVSNVPDPDAKYLASATVIYRVFDLYSLLGLGGVLLFLILLLVAYKGILDIARSRKKFDKSVIRDGISSFDDVITLITEGKEKEPTLSTRLVFLIIAFTAVMTSTAYQSGFFVLMSIPLNFNTKLTEETIIQNLEMKKFRLIDTQYNYDNANFYDRIRYRQEEFYQRFRKIIEENPLDIENDQDKLNEKLTTQFGYVKISDIDLATDTIGINPCDVTWVSAEYHSAAWEGFVFRKNSIWQRLFMKNMIMNEMFINSVYERYMVNKTSVCTSPTNIASLPILSLLSVFLLPMMGGLVGAGLLCFELLNKRHKRRVMKYDLSRVSENSDIMFPQFQLLAQAASYI